MSLNEKKAEKRIDPSYRADVMTKEITFVGESEDIDALKQIIERTRKMFNVDIDVDNKDLPSRISLSPEIEPNPTMYPRTAGLLRELGEALEHKQDKTVAMGELPILLERSKMAKGTKYATGIMQNISQGSQENPGQLPRPMKKQFLGLVNALDDIIKAPNLEGLVRNPKGKEVGVLKDVIKPDWAYLQIADVHYLTSDPVKPKEARDSIGDLKKIDKLEIPYPPDFGKSEGRRGKLHNQGYVAIFRGDNMVSMATPVQVSQGKWNKFLKDRQLSEKQISRKHLKKPKTMQDLLEFFFAYNVGNLMGLKGAEVKPIVRGGQPITTNIMQGTGENGEVKGIKVMYTSMVVGRGDFKPAGIEEGKAKRIGALDIDDFPGY